MEDLLDFECSYPKRSIREPKSKYFLGKKYTKSKRGRGTTHTIHQIARKYKESKLQDELQIYIEKSSTTE